MEQLQLLLRDQKKEVGLEVILSCPTFKDALKLCKSISGLDDKQIAGTLDIDPAQWSRIFGNGGNFPENKLIEYMELCRNMVPLIWLAHRCGYGIHPLKSELELENDTLREQLKAEQQRVAVISEFLKGIKLI